MHSMNSLMCRWQGRLFATDHTYGRGRVKERLCTDPTTLAVGACLCLPFIVELLCHDTSQVVFRRPPTSGEVCLPAGTVIDTIWRLLGVLAQRQLWLAVAGVITTVLVARNANGGMAPPPLLLHESRAASWYLWCAWFVHMMRPGNLLQERDDTLWLIAVVEFFLTGPLCVLLHIAYHNSSPLRDTLEVLVCSLQLYGFVVFAGTELLHGLGTSADLRFCFGVTAVVQIAVPMAQGIQALIRVFTEHGYPNLKEVKVS